MAAVRCCSSPSIWDKQCGDVCLCVYGERGEWGGQRVRTGAEIQ